jgi:ethanolamine utilization protein EutP
MMKKMILMGKTGCGKTTLCQKIHGEMLTYKKTQALEMYTNAIDTPGEYLENRLYYKALIVTAADAEVIALINDPTQEESFIPPGFACIFSKPVIGIITKIDLAEEQKIKRAEEKLKEAGVCEIFKVSATDDFGMNALLNYLNQ